MSGTDTTTGTSLISYIGDDWNSPKIWQALPHGLRIAPISAVTSKDVPISKFTIPARTTVYEPVSDTVLPSKVNFKELAAQTSF